MNYKLAFWAILVFALGNLCATDKPVNVPYSAAVYGPPGGFGPADVRNMLEYSRRTAEATEETRDLVKGTAGPASKSKDQIRFESAQKSCGSCHTPSKADTDGKGFILWATDERKSFAPFNATARRKLKEKILNGDMPPNGVMPEEEKAAWRD